MFCHILHNLLDKVLKHFVQNHTLLDSSLSTTSSSSGSMPWGMRGMTPEGIDWLRIINSGVRTGELSGVVTKESGLLELFIFCAAVFLLGNGGGLAWGGLASAEGWSNTGLGVVATGVRIGDEISCESLRVGTCTSLGWDVTIGNEV